MSDTLLELAERCEKATGEDFQLNHDIAAASGQYVHEKRGRDQKPWYYPSDGQWFMRRSSAPRYTASLDAAMTLVPEGLSFKLYGHPGERGNHADVFRTHPDKGLLGEAEMCATPALALCVAALRAKATEGKREGGGW